MNWIDIRMNWIDIRIRKPTEADGDKNGKVLQLLKDGKSVVWNWGSLDLVVAWMPIPPFNPPEIPEGWRVVDTASEKKHMGMKNWGNISKGWFGVQNFIGYDNDKLYITPIEPEPQYRPFANAAEFRPFAQKEWRYKKDGQWFDHQSSTMIVGMVGTSGTHLWN